MRYLFVLLSVLITRTAPAQQGFSRTFDFGELAAGFGSMELAGDTLVLYGSALEEGWQAFGMLFARFDTSGHLIDYHICNDSLNDDFTAVYPNSLVKLSDNSGYVGVGQFFYRKNGYLARFDNSGALIYLREFPDPASEVDFYKEVKELSDGLLILGDKQNTSNGVLDVFIMKTDFEGNKIWEQKFSTPGRQTLFGSALITDANEYVISASTTAAQGLPLPQIKNTSKIFAIDSLGNAKWQWESQPSLEELGAGSLFKTPEGYWAYTSARGWYNATYNEISKQPKFIIRDDNFDIIRDDTFGVADFPINYFTKAIELNEGGWLAIGLKPVNYPIPPVPMWYNSFSGWMVRLDSQGEQLWSRVDTAFWSYETGSVNYLYDAVELPSGSIVACGFSQTYEPFPKDWGWLIKVSKDGCLDTLFCSPVSTSFPIIPDKAVTLYPNPATSWVNIQSKSIDKWDRIEVFNVHGQLMQAMRNTTESRVDISRLDDGMYFIRLTKAGQYVTKKVIKRR